jgi:hypothetical protein
MNSEPEATSDPEGLAASLGLSADGQRGRLRDFLAQQRQRWDHSEAQLRQQIEGLSRQLAASQQAVRPHGFEADLRDVAQLREQLETARYCEKQLADEVESLRFTCDQLRQEQLAHAQSSAGRGPAGPGSVLSWEEEKRRILAALESEVDADDAAAVSGRLQLEEVLKRTDRIVADKQREIVELQGLLAQQSGNLGAVAVGAAALGELIDQDAIIREERQALKRLQEEWRLKLRQAEIEISQERAQIARQRAEIEEKSRALEVQRATPEVAGEEASLTSKPVRGRWLARLGLKELE